MRYFSRIIISLSHTQSTMRFTTRHYVVQALIAMLYCGGAFVFNACAKHNPPSWYLSQPPTNTQKFYGVGTGESLAQAKQEALNDLAQSLISRIRSSTQILNTQDSSTSSSTLSQDINLDIPSLALQNIHIANKAYAQGKYFVQVSATRNDIIAPLQQALKERATQTKHINERCISLRDFSLLQNAYTSMQEMTQILSALNTTPIKEYQRLESLYKSALPKPPIAIFYHNINKIQAQVLLAEVAKFAVITRSSSVASNDIFALDSTKNPMGKDSTQTLILSLRQNPNPKGVELRLEATLYDCKQQVLFQTTIIESQATSDYALRRIGVVLYKRLNDFIQGDE